MRTLLALCLFLLVLLIPKWFHACESVNSVDTSNLPIYMCYASDDIVFDIFFNEQFSSSNTVDEIKALCFCFPNQVTIPSGNCVDDGAVTFIKEIISKFSPYIIPCPVQYFKQCDILISNIPFGIPLIIPEAKKPERKGIGDGVKEQYYSKPIKSEAIVLIARSTFDKDLIAI